MKRQALLLGNNEGLAGVKIDIANFSNFLISNSGGAWESTEIDTYMNIRKTDLISLLGKYYYSNIDFLIIYFSGHGGQDRETMLELNQYNESISETDLLYKSDRQLNIYDCCRSYPEIKTDSLLMKKALFSESESYLRRRIRLLYEERIMSARTQQVKLFSCSVGEYSNDTREGGLYTQNFLKAAKKNSNTFKLVSEAHEEAASVTTVQSNGKQNPDHMYPKLSSKEQLIISINV